MAERNGYEFPKFDVAKFDVGGVVAMHKSNLETMVQAQRIMTDAAQSIAKLQAGYVSDLVSQMQGAFQTKDAKKPESWLADGQAAVEKAMSVAKEQLSVGTKAQSEVVELITKRAGAGFEQAKSAAA